MIDKKQVMFDIERCICHVPDACRDCSKYKGIDGLRCMEELMTDAYTLLKEQEAKPVMVEKNAYNHEFFYCPSCGRSFYGVFKRPKYCDQCGQAVKWE